MYFYFVATFIVWGNESGLLLKLDAVGRLARRLDGFSLEKELRLPFRQDVGLATETFWRRC